MIGCRGSHSPGTAAPAIAIPTPYGGGQNGDPYSMLVGGQFAGGNGEPTSAGAVGTNAGTGSDVAGNGGSSSSATGGAGGFSASADAASLAATVRTSGGTGAVVALG